MKRIRKTGRRAIAVVVAVVLGVGYIAVNASETDVETKVVEEVVKATTQQQWYSTNASGDFIGVMLTTPPTSGNTSSCDEDNLGAYCAKLLEFDDSVDPADLQNNELSDINDYITPVDEISSARQLP